MGIRENESVEIELNLLIDAILQKYGYDFRQYARASLKRRALQAAEHLRCRSISELQSLVLHDEESFPRLLSLLTVPVTEMFRDPSFFYSFRQNVVPLLKTYPSLKLWVAGCCTGEEAFSLAIVLAEENLLGKTLIYGTDINPFALETARRGLFDLEHMQKFTKNYQLAGGKREFSSYYHSDYSSAVLDSSIRSHIVFSDHSLVTDNVFSEVQFISCRNVMIYFNRELQDRALDLFRSSLSRGGILAVGTKESLRFSAQAKNFRAYVPGEKIFQKVS